MQQLQYSAHYIIWFSKVPRNQFGLLGIFVSGIFTTFLRPCFIHISLYFFSSNIWSHQFAIESTAWRWTGYPPCRFIRIRHTVRHVWETKEIGGASNRSEQHLKCIQMKKSVNHRNLVYLWANVTDITCDWNATNSCFAAATRLEFGWPILRPPMNSVGTERVLPNLEESL